MENKKEEQVNSEHIVTTPEFNKTKRKYSFRTMHFVILLFLIVVLVTSIGIIKSIPLFHKMKTKSFKKISTFQILNGHPELSFNTKATLLMTIPGNCDSAYRYFTSFSPNGRNVGYICGSGVKKGSDWYSTNQVIVDNKKQNTYNSVSSVAFDSHYDEYAYIAKHDRDSVIFNGVEVGSYPSDRVSPLNNTGNNNSLFYNGHLAYISNANNSISFIYDGKVVAQTGHKYSFIFNPLVSNDGNHYVFSAEKGSEENSVIVRDGNEIDRQNGFIRGLVISNDASKFAYSLESTDSAKIVVNGVVGKTYKKITDINMSNDGNHVAFLAQNQGDPFWIVDGKEYSQFTEVGDTFLFSPDSKHFVFQVVDPNNSHHQSFIEDGQLLDSYKIVNNPVFNKDGNTLAFFATLNNVNYVIVNNVKTPIVLAYPSQVPSNLTLSPDGSKVFYKVSDGIHENAIINGKISESYDVMPTQFYFSSDGKYVGFGIQKANQLWWIAMNFTKQDIPDPLNIIPTSTPTPTIVLPSPTTSPSSYTTFTSNELGISFNYPSVSWNITTQVVGSKIFFGNDTGQFIQVFHLPQPASSIESAIKSTVLKEYSNEDCQVVTEKPGFRGFGLNMDFAYITFPGNDGGDENQPAEAFCPQGYVNKGGLFYFIMDENHPSTLLFIAESQQPLAGVGQPITSSIKILY